MCGRLTKYYTWREIWELYQLTNLAAPNIEPSWNVKPTQTIPIVKAGAAGNELDFARWWMLPAWWKEPDLKQWKATTFNAMAETVQEKTTFASSFKAGRRCLVPTSGWYEWQEIGPKKKRPLYMHQAGTTITTLAGLWNAHDLNDGTRLLSCTIVTTEPGAWLEGIHDRAPVILEPGQFETWMRGPPDEAFALLKPFTGTVDLHEVGPAVGNRVSEGPQLIEPVQPPLL